MSITVCGCRTSCAQAIIPLLFCVIVAVVVFVVRGKEQDIKNVQVRWFLSKQLIFISRARQQRRQQQ